MSDSQQPQFIKITCNTQDLPYFETRSLFILFYGKRNCITVGVGKIGHTTEKIGHSGKVTSVLTVVSVCTRILHKIIASLS